MHIKTHDLSSIANPILSDNILTHANAYLRATPTFDLFYNILNDDPYKIDLDHYTHLSTYDTVPIDYSLTDFIHSINGKQLGLLEGEGDRRYTTSTNLRGFTDTTKRMVVDLERMLNGWHCAEALEVTDGDEKFEMLHLLSLEWGARMIVGLAKELEARKEGKEVYEAMYKERELWWQKIHVHS